MYARPAHREKHNEWVIPKQDGYLMECCDCGLVHSVDFAPIFWIAPLTWVFGMLGAKAMLRVRREVNATIEARRIRACKAEPTGV